MADFQVLYLPLFTITIDSSLVPHLVLLPLKENIQNHIVLAYRKNNAPSILADTIIDIIKTETPRLARI